MSFGKIIQIFKYFIYSKLEVIHYGKLRIQALLIAPELNSILFIYPVRLEWNQWIPSQDIIMEALGITASESIGST